MVRETRITSELGAVVNHGSITMDRVGWVMLEAATAEDTIAALMESKVKTWRWKACLDQSVITYWREGTLNRQNLHLREISVRDRECATCKTAGQILPVSLKL